MALILLYILISIKILYKFKVKKLLNLLEINNLNLNNLITLSNISIIEELAKSFAIKALAIKRIVAIRVSLRKSSTFVIKVLIIKRIITIRVSLRKSFINIISITINIFFAELDSYYS